MRRIACGVVLLAYGCSSDTGGDVTGPFSGEVHRYQVDKMTLPSTTALSNQLADDLDGDGAPDNQLGLIDTALTQTGDTNQHVGDIVASGALASFLEIQADHLDTDGSVGVRYLGTASSDATAVGGRIEYSEFTSNRTATTKVPGTAEVALPVFADADPLVVPLVGVEIDLKPDGMAGYDAVVRGGIPVEQARTVAYASVAQMMRNNPTAHLTFARMLDTNHDGAITLPELMDSGLLAGFIVDDVTLGGQPALSVAFGVHVCLEAQCATFPPVNKCTDRIKDGDETDVDCGGGTCPTCAADLACTGPGDCQTGGCTGNACRAPTCSDGFRDGFESDIDCGAACPVCTAGHKCATGADCASGQCNSGTCGS